MMFVGSYATAPTDVDNDNVHAHMHMHIFENHDGKLFRNLQTLH